MPEGSEEALYEFVLWWFPFRLFFLVVCLGGLGGGFWVAVCFGVFFCVGLVVGCVFGFLGCAEF